MSEDSKSSGTWYLLWTDFVDDYKPRGDWSKSKVYFFDSEASAEKYVNATLISKLKSSGQIDEWLSKDLKDYFKMDDDENITALDSVDAADAFGALEELLNQAEYVSRNFEYTIKRVEMTRDV